MSGRWGLSRAVGLVVAAAVIFMAVPGRAPAATLAATPYMGWNTYYGVGGVFDEATIKSVAESLISSGLRDAGYRMVWLDFGWASGARDSSGQLTVDPSQWPDGMSGLTAWLHQNGFEAGIYTDAGRSGCSGQGVGSYGHYQQDADTFAAWGFDAVKVDFCGAGQEIAAGQLNATPQQLYAEFSDALANNSSGRPIILNVCNFWTPGQIDGTNPSLANSSWDSYQWAPQIAQSWRTDTDIGFGGGRGIAFSDVLRNLDRDAAHPEAAGPGHWNDPDYLGPALGMTDTEAQAQFSMWAILAAPLILGSDPRKLSQDETAMLENPNVIAVDQDSLGAQGALISQSGSGQVWAKPLADGDVAVALLNRGTSSMSISTTATAVGLSQAGSYTLQDLWADTTTTTTGPITASVAPQSVTLYRVSANAPDGSTATLRISMAGADSGTVSADPGPISCPGTCSARYPTNGPVTLTASPTGGATFVGWSGGGCSGTGSCTVTMSSETGVNAAFAFPTPTLSVSVAGSGSVSDGAGLISCPGSCSGRYWDGSEVTLAASPRPGYVFTGWSGGGCSGTGTCTVPLQADAAVTASFAPARTLSVSVIGAGAGTVTGPGLSCPGTCSASYAVGTPVTLTATPAASSRFGAWVAGPCASASPSCTVTLSADTSATVAFDRPRSGTAYVASARTDTVTPIDLSTGTPESAIHGFHQPRRIAITPDGGTAYVVNAGNDTVTPIDLATNQREPAISGFDDPGPIAIAAGGRTAYVLEGDRRLVPVDLSTGRVESPVRFTSRSGVDPRAASIALAPDGKTAYLGTFRALRGGRASGTVTAIDLATGKAKAVIHGFGRPSAIAISSDGRSAYVADSALGTVIAIDLVTDRVAARTAPGTFPGAAGLAVAPDGTTLYVADDRATVSAIDDERVIGVAGAGAVAISPDGGAVYAISSGVLPIDVATNTVRPRLTGIASPASIAIAVPPPQGDSAKLSARVKVTNRVLDDAVTCLSSTSSCATIQTLMTRSGTIIGRRTVTIRPDRTVKVTVTLDPAAAQLLDRFGSLPALLTVAMRRNGHTDPLTVRELVIKPNR